MPRSSSSCSASAVDETVPLLEDLEPASEQLADTSKHLKPVLQDLRPAVKDLRPALTSLAQLLNETPAMMDAGTATSPDITKAVTTTQPMAEFLRPYEQTAKVCEMHWAPPFVVHAAARLSERELGQEAGRYRTYLEDLF